MQGKSALRVGCRPGTWRNAAIAFGLAVAVPALSLPALPDTMGKKQYWATSLSDGVDAALLLELYAAVRRGEVGWVG